MPRRYKKRRRRRNRDSLVNMSHQPFPKSWITKHRYVETITLDPASGVPATHYFSCNGMFDPNTSGIGHQPLGFDEMTAIYDHYTVLGARITVKAMSAAADVGSGGTMVGCYINDDASGVTTYDTILEQGNGVSRILTGNTANGLVTFKKNFSTKRFFGVSDVKDNDQLKGSAVSDPSDEAHFVVFAQGISTSSNPTAVYATVLIEYIAQWSEPRSISQS